jgi:hypothetical protein
MYDMKEKCALLYGVSRRKCALPHAFCEECALAKGVLIKNVRYHTQCIKKEMCIAMRCMKVDIYCDILLYQEGIVYCCILPHGVSRRKCRKSAIAIDVSRKRCVLPYNIYKGNVHFQTVYQEKCHTPCIERRKCAMPYSVSKSM